MEIEFFYFLVFVLATLQAIIGVGVLVLGTPLLLIFNYDIIEIMALLLPISIVTSLLNYLFLRYNKKKFKINLDKNIKKTIFGFLLPGMGIGLILTKNYFHHIRFDILVSLIIFLSLAIKLKFQNTINALSPTLKRAALFLIGIVHGITNSGGALLVIFFSSLVRNKKNQSRFELTFYYLFLALVQYLIFLTIFKKELFLDYPFEILLIVIPSLFAGNRITKSISEKFFKRILELLVLFAGIFLILNNW
jgi:uncharacterized membrane protein YfcA